MMIYIKKPGYDHLGRSRLRKAIQGKAELSSAKG